ncbi:hypothetical protein [Stenotrophomonas rhizophila]|uniref:hypothetical protein n=1 Tax=Stenotrophomonas rhizophila TaxID=216778 RepID=UPI0028D670BE|nr:hypothetical protein [Stenotrophomonas rhizophila]
MKVQHSAAIEHQQAVEQAMRRWQVLAGVGMVWLAATAAAQAPYVAIEQRVDPQELARVGLSPAQLQTLNRLLREADARSPAPPVAAAPVAPGATIPAPMFPGLDDGPINAKVTGQVDGWAPGTVFTLDNGQQWQVLKGEMKLKTSRSNPAIVVVPGIAGRWFLQVDEDLPKARVFRIR